MCFTEKMLLKRDLSILRKEFEVNGFKIEEFYSDVAGKPFNSKSTEFAIVARKLDK